MWFNSYTGEGLSFLPSSSEGIHHRSNWVFTPVKNFREYKQDRLLHEDLFIMNYWYEQQLSCRPKTKGEVYKGITSYIFFPESKLWWIEEEDFFRNVKIDKYGQEVKAVVPTLIQKEVIQAKISNLLF